jgi:tetratricopeptide (TPR) repeat protein
MSNDVLTKSYVTTILNCYSRETEIPNIDNMSDLSQALFHQIGNLNPHLTSIADVMTACYRGQKDPTVRSAIVELLKQLKDSPELESTTKLPLEKALAECSELSLEKKDDASQAANSVIDLTSAAESFRLYAEKVEGELSEVYQKKYIDALMMKAQAHQNNGELDPALNDYKIAFETSHSEQALSQMALIETELGFYEEAIEHYRLLSENVFSGQTFSWFHTALFNLKKMHEEMIEGDSRRQEIGIILGKILNTTLENYEDQITTLEAVTEFEEFANIANNDEIFSRLKIISDNVVPIEQERLEREKKEEDRARQLQRQIEGKGRSSELQLSTLLSLQVHEKNNPEAIIMVNAAIKKWIDSVVKTDEGKIFIRNEPGMVQLAKQGNLLALFYLAKLCEQKNDMHGALSLYATIIMSPRKDPNDVTLQQDARRFLESYTSQTGGITKFFSKAYTQFAIDLLSIVKQPSSIADPFTAIESALHEKPAGSDGVLSYNTYILAVGGVLGMKEEIVRPMYRRPTDPSK